VEVEWDGRKAEANLRKHGVAFEDAATVAYDRRAVTTNDDRFAEPRFMTIGRDSLGRILLVVGTWRSSHIRLISARRATAREKRVYNEGR
jgi:uncharacterized DUF497 family protein